MTNINIVKVNNENESKVFDTLYNSSAITMEGLAEESINDYIEWIDNLATMKDTASCYVITGEQMNNYYNLNGNNAYPSDLCIVSVSLNDIEDSSKLIMSRFQVGARWFDDIVDNNKSREI